MYFVVVGSVECTFSLRDLPAEEVTSTGSSSDFVLTQQPPMRRQIPQADASRCASSDLPFRHSRPFPFPTSSARVPCCFDIHSPLLRARSVSRPVFIGGRSTSPPSCREGQEATGDPAAHDWMTNTAVGLRAGRGCVRQYVVGWWGPPFLCFFRWMYLFRCW